MKKAVREARKKNQEDQGHHHHPHLHPHLDPEADLPEEDIRKRRVRKKK